MIRSGREAGRTFAFARSIISGFSARWWHRAGLVVRLCYRGTEAPGERGQSPRKNGSEPPAAAYRNIETW